MLSIILPSYNESANIEKIIDELLLLNCGHKIEIIVVDDDSQDGTSELVRAKAQLEQRIKLVRRVGRSGLASAIKEGLLDATGEFAIVMDSDGQHETNSIINALSHLENGVDIVVGSRFHQQSNLQGLSKERTKGSVMANRAARISLSGNYSELTDYMSGFFAIKLDSSIEYIRKVDVEGFKFLYELLAISKGHLKAKEIPLSFRKRDFGESKLDIAIFWDFLISVLHTITLRSLPRRAISFGLVGCTGVVVQLTATFIFMSIGGQEFTSALLASVTIAACSNYLINNALTFRHRRLKGRQLINGLGKFLLVSSLPIIANIGLASTVYPYLSNNSTLAQIVGILLAFVWNYAASSKLVWNTP